MRHFELNSDSDSDSDSKPCGYIVLCRTCFHWLRFRSFSQMGTVPTLWRDLCPYYIHFNQGAESKSGPMEKSCIEQKSVSESESDSESRNGNKPKHERVDVTIYSFVVVVNPTYSDLPKITLRKTRDVDVVVNTITDPGHFYVTLSGRNSL